MSAVRSGASRARRTPNPTLAAPSQSRGAGCSPYGDVVWRVVFHRLLVLHSRPYQTCLSRSPALLGVPWFLLVAEPPFKWLFKLLLSLISNTRPGYQVRNCLLRQPISRRRDDARTKLKRQPRQPPSCSSRKAPLGDATVLYGDRAITRPSLTAMASVATRLSAL
jgi:hypothetical protein